MTSSNGNIFRVTGPSVRGIQPSSVNSPHKGQWCRALMFSVICAWINGWVNHREAGDLRRHRAHYDVTLMPFLSTIHGVTSTSTTTHWVKWRGILGTVWTLLTFKLIYWSRERMAAILQMTYSKSIFEWKLSHLEANFTNIGVSVNKSAFVQVITWR